MKMFVRLVMFTVMFLMMNAEANAVVLRDVTTGKKDVAWLEAKVITATIAGVKVRRLVYRIVIWCKRWDPHHGWVLYKKREEFSDGTLPSGGGYIFPTSTSLGTITVTSTGTGGWTWTSSTGAYGDIEPTEDMDIVPEC